MSDSSEDEETVAALLAARTAREERRAHERRTALDVARLVAHAEAVSARGQWIEAIELYTRGVAQQPNDTELLAARASACARAGHYAAALHDGELMVSLLPDWYRGYQVCGSALFCLRRFASAARAYSAAVRLAAPSTTGGLRDALHDCHKKIDDALRRAIMEDDLDALSSLLASGEVQLQMADESNGFVPLTLAAAAGRRHACAVLLDAGADPNARDKYGKTPLLWAAAFGHQAAAAELLGTHRGHQASTEQSASGSSLNSRIFEGGPSEITACIDDSMGIDDGNRRSDGDRRPFGMENSGAAIHHHLPSHSPSRAVADLRATDYRGWDALFHACYAGHLQLAKSFMQGVDLARTDKGTVLPVPLNPIAKASGRTDSDSSVVRMQWADFASLISIRAQSKVYARKLSACPPCHVLPSV